MWGSKSKYTLLVILTGILLSGASCGVTIGGGGGGSSGVYKSFDKGKTWEQRVFVRQVKKKIETIGSANATVIRLDPDNPDRIYLGTANQGLWFSDDATETWRELYPKANVQDLAIDPKNEIIYFATSNSIYKSLDEGKTWPILYLETRKGVFITSLAVSSKNWLYAGSSNGELLVSSDFGNSWKVLRRFDDSIRKILVRPGNVDELFVGTSARGVWRSADAGLTWIELTSGLERTMRDVKGYRDLILDPASKRIVYASRYGILVSTDNGTTWTALSLLSASSTIDVSNLALDSKNPKVLYYTTATTLYRSFTAGDRWETITLPASRPTVLVVHPRDTGILYVGMSK